MRRAPVRCHPPCAMQGCHATQRNWVCAHRAVVTRNLTPRRPAPAQPMTAHSLGSPRHATWSRGEGGSKARQMHQERFDFTATRPLQRLSLKRRTVCFCYNCVFLCSIQRSPARTSAVRTCMRGKYCPDMVYRNYSGLPARPLTRGYPLRCPPRPRAASSPPPSGPRQARTIACHAGRPRHLRTDEHGFAA